MTINDQFRDEKLHQISALSSNKFHKYEYLTSNDRLPSNQQQIIELARFTYSPSGKSFEEQIKTIEDQRNKKQIKAIKDQGQLKAIKKMTMILKILNLSQNKEKYLINL